MLTFSCDGDESLAVFANGGALMLHIAGALGFDLTPHLDREGDKAADLVHDWIRVFRRAERVLSRRNAED
jgi:hypothetical protein